MSLIEYKKVIYDTISELIRFYRDMLESYGNIQSLANVSNIHVKLTEFQNIFTNHLIKASTKVDADRYAEITHQFILALFSDYSIPLMEFDKDETLCRTSS